MRNTYELKRVTTPKGKRMFYIDNKRVSELTYNRIDAGWIACSCITLYYNRNQSRVDCMCVETTKTV